MKVTVWNEFIQEKTDEPVAAVYPDGIHTVISEFLKSDGFDVKTATLEEKDHGLTEQILEQTDVLIWWGHKAHGDVDEKIVDRIQNRILNGMGLIALHSAHHSKIFKRMMGTTCDLGSWREDGKTERVWVIDPTHPISEGIDKYFDIPKTEMYGERIDVPEPDLVNFRVGIFDPFFYLFYGLYIILHFRGLSKRIYTLYCIIVSFIYCIWRNTDFRES